MIHNYDTTVTRNKTIRLNIPSLFLLALLCCTPDSSYSQCDTVIAPECEDAPLLDLINFCGRTYISHSSMLYVGFCGPNTAVHNPTYFQFVATDTIIHIEIEVLPCFVGNGLQSAIIPNCPWAIEDVIDCDPGTPPGSTMFLDVEDAIPGEIYWLLLDGSSGSWCSYLFTVVQGIVHEEPPIAGLQQVGGTLYVNTPGSFNYAWFRCEDNIVLDTAPSFVPPTTGCYCVSLHEPQDTHTFCTTVETTANQIIGGKEYIAFYPNPSSDYVEIQIREYQNVPVTLRIFDWQGRCVDNITLQKELMRYMWPKASVPGVYSFLITAGDETLAMKNLFFSGR